MLYLTDCIRLDSMPENCYFNYKRVPAKYVEKMRDNMESKQVVCGHGPNGTVAPWMPAYTIAPDREHKPGERVSIPAGAGSPIHLVPGDILASAYQTPEGELRFIVLRVAGHAPEGK